MASIDEVFSKAGVKHSDWKSITGVSYDSIIWEAEATCTEAEFMSALSELQAAEPIRLLRKKRNVLLEETDWTGLSDSALTNEVSAKWKLYRQKLRDLPAGLNTEFKVKNAVWPTKP